MKKMNKKIKKLGNCLNFVKSTDFIYLFYFSEINIRINTVIDYSRININLKFLRFNFDNPLINLE